MRRCFLLDVTLYSLQFRQLAFSCCFRFLSSRFLSGLLRVRHVAHAGVRLSRLIEAYELSKGGHRSCRRFTPSGDRELAEEFIDELLVSEALEPNGVILQGKNI